MSIIRERHAKILATIGPSSNTEEKLRELVKAGADAFRLNFSHGSHDVHRAVFETIRKLEKEFNHPIVVLQDLQGPKIRLGEMESGIVLKEGDTFTLDSDPSIGDASRGHLPHPEILDVLNVDDRVFINDGLVRLRVTDKKAGQVTCSVIAGGVVSSRKGVNLPGVDLPISAMTEKDRKDLVFGLELGVDWVAISFVQRKEDVEDVRAIVGNKAKVMAKIEMPNAVQRIDDIVAVCDGIMVARGDLGVELPLEEVPSIQKRLIRICREQGKPIVVATQMLESMVKNPSPTRAEVSDVANATYEGADALMLSAESAAGDYPVEAVTMMNNIICRVERSSAWQPLMSARELGASTCVSDAITKGAYTLAEEIEASAIVTFTESGSTALRMSRQRPVQPIYALTVHPETARYLSLCWGMNARIANPPQTPEDLVDIANETLLKEDVFKAGDHVVLTAGIPFGQKGSTNMLRVIELN